MSAAEMKIPATVTQGEGCVEIAFSNETELFEIS